MLRISQGMGFAHRRELGVLRAFIRTYLYSLLMLGYSLIGHPFIARDCRLSSLVVCLSIVRSNLGLNTSLASFPVLRLNTHLILNFHSVCHKRDWP